MTPGAADRSEDLAEPPRNSPRWRVFPTREQERHAAALLDQQLWCWGRDIVHPQGNVLLRLGMCQRRPPRGAGTSTAYSGEVGEGNRLTLWAFGVFLGHPGRGGVYVHRFGFSPLHVRQEQTSQVADALTVPTVSPPRLADEWACVRQSLQLLLGWIARYEHWVKETYGLAYREGCLAERGKTPAVPARRMTSAWEHLAKHCPRMGPHGRGWGHWERVIEALRPPRQPARKQDWRGDARQRRSNARAGSPPV